MIPCVWSDDFRLHVPAAEIWVGVRIPGTEVPARADAIRTALEEAGAELFPVREYPDEVLVLVHDPELIEFLRTAWERWVASGYVEDPGQDRVVPYAFPLPAVTSGRPPHRAARIGALAGMYAMDTMTLIGPGTWEGARAAAFAARTAAELVAEGRPAVYAACRPPGHHAGRRLYGGSCYLNNAALAAETLRAAGADPVAVIDLDAHHGNDTQEIFYDRSDVRYGSVHVDPGEGWFPHYVGFADETGEGEGEGANLNLPLAPGSGDAAWLEAVRQLAIFAEPAEALVVSLGVDAWRDDPESPLRLSEQGFAAAGRILGEMDRPIVLVQEGGYDLSALGRLVVAFLTGLEEGR